MNRWSSIGWISHANSEATPASNIMRRRCRRPRTGGGARHSRAGVGSGEGAGATDSATPCRRAPSSALRRARWSRWSTVRSRERPSASIAVTTAWCVIASAQHDLAVAVVAGNARSASLSASTDGLTPRCCRRRSALRRRRDGQGASSAPGGRRSLRQGHLHARVLHEGGGHHEEHEQVRDVRSTESR